MKNIIVITHTESVHHTNGMIGSWTDWELSNKGIEEAEKIAEKLSSELKDKKYVIYSSDLKRASMTAQPLAEIIGVEITYKQELREINLGECCGKSSKWYKEHSNKENQSSIDYKCFPSAESTREFYVRLEKVFNELIEEEDNIIIVTHGGVGSIFASYFVHDNIDLLNEFRVYMRSGSVSMYQIEGAKKVAFKIGDSSYKL